MDPSLTFQKTSDQLWGGGKKRDIFNTLLMSYEINKKHPMILHIYTILATLNQQHQQALPRKVL